jgi:hypothetical protein
MTVARPETRARHRRGGTPKRNRKTWRIVASCTQNRLSMPMPPQFLGVQPTPRFFALLGIRLIAMRVGLWQNRQ